MSEQIYGTLVISIYTMQLHHGSWIDTRPRMIPVFTARECTKDEAIRGAKDFLSYNEKLRKVVNSITWTPNPIDIGIDVQEQS